MTESQSGSSFDSLLSGNVGEPGAPSNTGGEDKVTLPVRTFANSADAENPISSDEKPFSAREKPLGGSVRTRTETPVSESSVSVSKLSYGGAGDVTQVKSDPVNLDATPNSDAGFKNDITDTSTQATARQDDAADCGNLTTRSPDNGDQGVANPQQPYRDPIASFGAEFDGSQPLSYVDRIPDDTIDYLREQIAQEVEGTDGPDQEFRDALRAWLTPELLFAEWARLRSSAGLPVKVPYKKQKYPAAIRMRPELLGAGDPGMDTMKSDGAPPVQIQRWAIGVAETGSTATTTDLRSLSQGFQTGWTSVYGDLLELAVNARVLFTYGQMTESPTLTQTDQSQRLLRSTGKSDPFNFTMNWELYRGDSVSRLFAGQVPSDDEWNALPPPPGKQLDPLRVWFPKYSSADQAAAAKAANPAARTPAPLTRLQHEFPHYGIITVRDHDRLLADVAASFPLLRDLSEKSREDLLTFLSEGDAQLHSQCLGRPCPVADAVRQVGEARRLPEVLG
jgi:hypothetical protein